MKKTTLYIEDDLLMKIKERTVRKPGTTLTRIVNDALRKYVDERPAGGAKFEKLKKALGSSPKFRKVKDPAGYQRELRSEWD